LASPSSSISFLLTTLSLSLVVLVQGIFVDYFSLRVNEL
jgi:hypothetical protein